MRALVLGLLVGCFRAPEAGEAAEVQLRDLAGAPVALDRAPRDLVFMGGVDELFLLRGHLDDVLLAQLSFTRPSSALAAQRVEIEGQVSLPPGRYTLVATRPEPRGTMFTVSASPALGASWVETAPGDGARVPSNLAQVLVRFDGHVQGALDTALRLPGFDVRVDRCAQHGLQEGDCAWLTPSAPLTAGRHALQLEPGVFTPGGAEISARTVAFEVAAAPDHQLPTLMATRCARDEREQEGICVRLDDEHLYVHGRSDEACFVSLTAGARRTTMLTYAGAFTLALAPPSAQGEATLRLTDLAGNVQEYTPPYELLALARVAIDELRPDPLGAEPAQEYVELLNFGAEPVPLMGFTLSTDASSEGRTIVAGELAPGERALVVGPAFDARDTQDGVLPGDIKLVTTHAALSLANAGGPVFLRDAKGRRLATARAIAPLVEGQCTHRIGPLLREAGWELDARGRCTPGSE